MMMPGPGPIDPPEDPPEEPTPEGDEDAKKPA